MNNIEAELCYYVDGQSHAIALTDTQFMIVSKILGLKITQNEVACFSDKSLQKMMKMKSNPLLLVEVKNQK